MPGLLARLLATLHEEETRLARLCALSREQRHALLASEFAAIDAINEQLLAVANSLLPCEAERVELLARLRIGTLVEASALAAGHGVAGFAETHERLRAAAATFRSAQEQNAALVLNAMRLRDRWLNYLGGRLSPTYDAGGKRDAGSGRSIVSKSA